MSPEFPSMNYSGMIGYFIHYSDEITATLAKLDKLKIVDAAELLYKAYSAGSHVFFAGNGGAAALANHAETDHIKHMSAVDTLYPSAHSLCGNVPYLTAVANDIGYDAIFSWQLERKATKYDVLVVFSVSGESRNIILALQQAREMGMKTIAITGQDAEVTATVHIKIPATNYGTCEDIMSIIQHALAQYIRQTQMTDQQILDAQF